MFELNNIKKLGILKRTSFSNTQVGTRINNYSTKANQKFAIKKC